jgi:DNA (cytosine-5)-methyltransferase 1
MSIPLSSPNEITDYTFADLFCGAGGLSLGLERAGLRCIMAIDSWKPAVESYNANFEDKATLAAITSDLVVPQVDVIVGGPPCQGFSSAGKRREHDPRNSLVRVFADAIARSRPKAFVFENVEGFLTGGQGRFVLDLLEPVLEAGYCVHLRKINAANYAVPQHRKRVVAIGGLGWVPPFPEPTHSAFGAPGARLAARHLPQTPTVAEVLAGLPWAVPDGVRDTTELADHTFVPLKGQDLERVSCLAPGETMRDLPEALWHSSFRQRAYRRVMDGTPTEKRGGAPAGIRRLRSDEPSKAITGMATSEFVHPSENRMLTLRECARIQTFPDAFVFRGTNTQRGILIGNAVPPNLGLAIAYCLKQGLETACVGELPGTLVSFVPTLSEGMSPALSSVTDAIRERFMRPQIVGVQLSIWH